MKPNTLLYRQIHPSFIQSDRVTSQVFCPTPKDKELLSVYNGSLISAEEAWIHYTQKQQLESVGVLAVSVAEVNHIGLQSRPDTSSFPEHAVIDFFGLSNKEKKVRSSLLATKARDRGWQYRSEE